MTVTIPDDVRADAVRICLAAAEQTEILETYDDVAERLGLEREGAATRLAVEAYFFAMDDDGTDVSAEDRLAAKILEAGWSPREPAKERA